MSLKEDFKQKKYQLVFDNLAKQCGGKPYGLYSWDFYYYVASGFFLEKEEITRDFIKGFFESIKSSNRSELDLRADNFIRGIYLRLLKKEHDLNGKLDYSYQARYVKQLFEAACFLEREDKSIESQFFMEYLVIDFVNGHLKSNRNESLDSQVLALLNLFDFSYFSSEPYTTIDTVKNKQIVHSSKQEKYFVMKIKLQQKLSLYQESVDTADLAISTIKEFHEQNDITILRKKITALMKLGKIDTAKQMIKELLTQKAEWYIFADLADIYQATKDIDASIRNFMIALLIPPEDYFIKVNVINRLATLLNDTDPEFSQVLFNFEYNLRKEKQWLLSEDLQQKYNPNVQVDVKKLKYRCLNMLYRRSKSIKAKISRILPNGKSGFIENYFFQFRNLMFRKEQAIVGTPVEFITIESRDKQGKISNEAIFITKGQS